MGCVHERRPLSGTDSPEEVWCYTFNLARPRQKRRHQTAPEEDDAKRKDYTGSELYDRAG